MASRRTVFGRLAMAAAALLALAACSGGAPGAGATTGDIALGKADAKVTIIEYASLTCAHCASFHTRDLPKIKAEYIDTGKVRYILREFPSAGYSPQVAMAQFLLARCITTDPVAYSNIISTMFGQFESTAAAFQSGQVRPHLIQLAQAAGLSQDRFNACVSDQAGIKRIEEVQAAGVRDFKIEATPTFVINGQKVDVNTYEGLKPLIDAKLAGA